MLSRAGKTSFGWDVLLRYNFTVDGQEHTVFVNTSHNMVQGSVVEVEICGISVVALVIAIVRVVDAAMFLLWIHDTIPSCTGISGGC